jgi:hypothetical protein
LARREETTEKFPELSGYVQTVRELLQPLANLHLSPGGETESQCRLHLRLYEAGGQW